MNMPKMNGKQFIAEVRKQKVFDPVKLIIYSTSRPENNAMHGADGFISKPTNQDELCQEIAKAISPDVKPSARHISNSKKSVSGGNSSKKG